MPKSYVADLTSVYLGVFQDAMYAFPQLGSDLVKDQIRFLSLVHSRGLPFLMVDLPNLGKHLDRCLSEGEYRSSKLPCSQQVSRAVQIPKLFRGLYLLIFEPDGRLKEDVNIEALIFLRQFLYGAKRANVECSESAKADEVNSFCLTDAQLPTPHPWWGEMSVENNERDVFQGFAKDSQIVARADEAQVARSYLEALDKIAGLLTSSLGLYDPSEWRFKHGRGAVSDVHTSHYRYRFITWPEMLETVFPVSEYGYSSYTHWAADVTSSYWGEAYEPWAQMMAVPKTVSKPRLIASEPVSHMWCQQNLRDYMYSRIALCWVGRFVRFTDQTRNQELCLRGSIDGSLATLDLSEASDRVTCVCVGNLFRGNPALLRALRATRTQAVRLPTDIENISGTVLLRKYSTMGNATTFPVESVIFLAVALAGCLGAKGTKVTLADIDSLVESVSVYGDDIIVPVAHAGMVKQLLEVLYFKVNVNKSFLTGMFRESCGVDAFRGSVVTPIYWHDCFDRTPESYDSIISTSNNLYLRFMVNAAEAVRTSIQGTGTIRFPLVPMDSGAVGFLSFVRPVCAHPERWNRYLQRREVRLPSFSTDQPRTPIHDDSALLQFFTELPDPLLPWSSGVRGRALLTIKQKWVSLAHAYPVGPSYKPKLDHFSWLLPAGQSSYQIPIKRVAERPNEVALGCDLLVVTQFPTEGTCEEIAP